MKKIISAGLAAIMLLCAVNAWAFVSPDYELTEWTITETGGTAQIDTAQKQNGVASLKVFSESGSGVQNIKIFQKVDGLEPSTEYEMTFYSKADNVSDFKIVRDIFYSSEARPEDSSAYDWGKTSVTFTTGASATSVQLQFIVRGDGSEGITLWIDECSLTKKGDTQNLLKNGGFDERVDITPPEPVSDAAAQTGDASALITWTDSVSEDYIGVFIYKNDEAEPVFVEKGAEGYAAQELENGVEYTFKICAADDWHNESDAVLVNVIPASQPEAPAVEADDENNVILNIDETMEYRIDGGEWVLYSADSEPDLEGTHVVEVRYAKTEEHTAGKITTLIFYKNRQETKADLTVDVKTNQESVTVSGNTSAETVSVVAEAANGAAYENIVFIKEVKASENSFTVEFLMPEGAGRGEYMINAGIPGLSERVKKEFYYVPGDIIAAFINEIKNADEQGIESLLLSQENKDILECLGIDTEKLYKIEDMSALAARLSEDKDKLDEQLLAEYAAVYTAFALIEQCASAAEVIEVIDEFNDDYLKLSFEEKGWQEIEDNALKAWLGDYLKGKEIDSPERMAEEYEAANILYLINTSSYVSIEEVITRYAQELGISSLSAYNRYLGLSDSAREDKNKDIKLKCDYHSVLDFKNEFTDIMSGSSGGSGGSGGGSGSGNNSGTGNNYITYNEQSSGIPNNVAPKEIFSDLDEAQWAKEEIEKLYELGVVSGMGDGRFEPNSPVTREQFAKMAVDAFGITGIGEPESFSDVPEDRWSYPYISVMRSNGLIAGYEDGSFKPDAEISREDIAVIICRVCDSVGIELGQTGNGEEFSDADEISGYAKESILRLNAAGIMSGMGDNTIAPKATATRAMAAKIICMVMEER